eukprot:gene24647-biopygen10453
MQNKLVSASPAQRVWLLRGWSGGQVVLGGPRRNALHTISRPTLRSPAEVFLRVPSAPGATRQPGAELQQLETGWGQVVSRQPEVWSTINEPGRNEPVWEKRKRTRTGRRPGAGRTMESKETDADRTRAASFLPLSAGAIIGGKILARAPNACWPGAGK